MPFMHSIMHCCTLIAFVRVNRPYRPMFTPPKSSLHMLGQAFLTDTKDQMVLGPSPGLARLP